MARMRLIDASTWLAFAAAGLFLLGTATPLAAPQEGSQPPPPKLSRRARSTKPTWHSGPATTPPQTEVVPPPPEAPPPAKSLLRGQAEGKKPDITKPGAVTPADPGFLTTNPQATAHEPAPTPNATQRDDSTAPDPEPQRIRNELDHLRNDAGARRAFYDELRRTVEQVRAGQRDEDSKNPASSRPGWHLFHDASGEPANPPATNEPNESPPANPQAPQAFLGTHRGSLDRAAYLRVVRNAKANGAPVPLALGVAWIESHLQTYPPRGAAGEVGMFQILPARCRMEGWPPERLKEPEFNAWLGTRLLARYYWEEGNWARAAAKYVAGPEVFDRSYSQDLWAYINWYASSVESYAGYFSRYQS